MLIADRILEQRLGVKQQKQNHVFTTTQPLDNQQLLQQTVTTLYLQLNCSETFGPKSQEM